MIEMIMTLPPLADLHPVEAMAQIRQHRSPLAQCPLSDCPDPAIRDFMSCCLCKDPLRRPAACALLAHPLMTEAAEHEEEDMQAMGSLLESLTCPSPTPAAEQEPQEPEPAWHIEPHALAAGTGADADKSAATPWATAWCGHSSSASARGSRGCSLGGKLLRYSSSSGMNSDGYQRCKRESDYSDVGASRSSAHDTHVLLRITRESDVHCRSGRGSDFYRRCSRASDLSLQGTALSCGSSHSAHGPSRHSSAVLGVAAAGLESCEAVAPFSWRESSLLAHGVMGSESVSLPSGSRVASGREARGSSICQLMAESSSVLGTLQVFGHRVHILL